MKMRTKTLRPKPRSCNSIKPSNSIPLYEDEANEECHVDVNGHGASKDTGSVQDNDNMNNDDGNGNDVGDHKNEDDGGGDYDNVVFPDSVEEVERCSGRNNAAGPSRDCIIVHWLEGEVCIMCNRGCGQLLVCSENGCPVAIHEACMKGKPEFDDMGKFFCPYCWYKQALARTKELRKEAMCARTELSNFICLKRDGGNEEKRENETEKMEASSISKMEGKISAGDCGNGLHDDDNRRIHHKQEEIQSVESISKEKSNEESISRAHGFENVGDGERTEEEFIENASDSDDDQRENLENRETEEPLLTNVAETTIPLVARGATSKVLAIESFRYVSPSLDTLDTETLVVRPKRIKRRAQKAQHKKVDSPKNSSSQPSTGANYQMNPQEKATAANNSVQRQQLIRKLMVPTLGGEKRRRLYWTAEEEDMLTEGVRRFSATANKNIPWRKILEFGHNVFHETRTPVDLKDKWKNMMAKDDPKSNMGLLIKCGGLSDCNFMSFDINDYRLDVAPLIILLAKGLLTLLQHKWTVSGSNIMCAFLSMMRSKRMGRTDGFNVAIYTLVIAYLGLAMNSYPLIVEARIPDFATLQGATLQENLLVLQSLARRGTLQNYKDPPTSTPPPSPALAPHPLPAV